MMKTIDNDDIQPDDNDDDDDESATRRRNVGPTRVVNISLMYNEHIKLHYPDRPFTIAHRQEH